MRFSRIALSLLVLSIASGAKADAIRIQRYTIEREYDRPSSTEPLKISKRDCEENAEIDFYVDIDAPRLRTLHIWSGPESCTDLELRTSGDCEEIASRDVSGQDTLLTITAQDLVGEDCEGIQSDNNGVERTLLFAFNDSSGAPSDSESTTTTITYDVKAPSPPRLTGLTPGEGQLQVRWEAVSGIDLAGHRFYCAASSGAPDDMTATGEGGAAGASTLSEECPSALVPGMQPDESLLCGEQAGELASRGTARGLANNAAYAVGIAATDLVGNVGTLSSTLCATPVEVTDFFEAYKDAGGKGGGGFFCSLSHRHTPAGAWPGLLLAAAGAQVLRRRRGRS